MNWPLAPSDFFKTSFEDCWSSDDVKELCQTKYLAVLDKFVTGLMRYIDARRSEAGLDRVPILCFGSSIHHGRVFETPGYYGLAVKIEPVGYVPETLIDIFGTPRLVATRKEMWEMKYNAGDSKIFTDF